MLNRTFVHADTRGGGKGGWPRGQRGRRGRIMR